MTRYLTALWALIYGVVALTWTITGHGYPFGANDPGNDLNLLRFVPTDTGAVLFAVTMLAVAVIAAVMAAPVNLSLPGAMLVFGWLVAAALLVVVPDVSVLTLAGYAPMLILGAPFGWPPVDFDQVIDWPMLNQLWCVLGGLLLARTLLLRQRPGWLTGHSVRRWARPVTYVAAVIPLTYAVTRLAWLVGIPLGISERMLGDLWKSGAVWAGAGLGAFAILGSVLTLGLTQRWGEVFPRWMPGLAGRRVPVMLAVVPAVFVAVSVTSASLSLLSNARMYEVMAGVGSMVALPMLLWPVWGIALAAAAFAYYSRRRTHVTDVATPDQVALPRHAGR